MAPFNLTILAMSSIVTEGTRPLQALFGVSNAQKFWEKIGESNRNRIYTVED